MSTITLTQPQGLNEVPYCFKEIAENFESKFTSFAEKERQYFSNGYGKKFPVLSIGSDYTLGWAENGLMTKIFLSLQYPYGSDDKLQKDRFTMHMQVFCRDENQKDSEASPETINQVRSYAIEQFKIDENRELYINNQPCLFKAEHFKPVSDIL